jgi:hypothetical protein
MFGGGADVVKNRKLGLHTGEDGPLGPWFCQAANSIMEKPSISGLSMNHPALIDEIRELLAAPRSGRRAPSLSDIEHTLTTGYAQALALEAERTRIERRLGEVAASAGENGAATEEIAALGRRLSDADGELSNLRMLLESLRMRASDARVTASRA